MGFVLFVFNGVGVGVRDTEKEILEMVGQWSHHSDGP